MVVPLLLGGWAPSRITPLSHKKRPFKEGEHCPTLAKHNHGYYPLTNWDDPPSMVNGCHKPS